MSGGDAQFQCAGRSGLKSEKCNFASKCSKKSTFLNIFFSNGEGPKIGLSIVNKIFQKTLILAFGGNDATALTYIIYCTTFPFFRPWCGRSAQLPQKKAILLLLPTYYLVPRLTAEFFFLGGKHSLCSENLQIIRNKYILWDRGSLLQFVVVHQVQMVTKQDITMFSRCQFLYNLTGIYVGKIFLLLCSDQKFR